MPGHRRALPRRDDPGPVHVAREAPYGGNTIVSGYALRAMPALITSAFLILATHLVHRAQDLRHRLPEVRPVFSYAHSKNGGSVPSPAFCPRKDHPMAYAEMMSGVENVIANLPDSCCINALEPPPWTHPDVPMIVGPPHVDKSSTDQD